jgi:hypothetical protein
MTWNSDMRQLSPHRAPTATIPLDPRRRRYLNHSTRFFRDFASINPGNAVRIFGAVQRGSGKAR